MPRLAAKKAVRKKPLVAVEKSATVKTATKKKTTAKRSVKAATKHPTTDEQAIAPDGVPWPRIPRIYGRGNLTAKQIREAVLRAMAAVEADRLAAKTHSDEVES